MRVGVISMGSTLCFDACASSSYLKQVQIKTQKQLLVGSESSTGRYTQKARSWRRTAAATRWYRRASRKWTSASQAWGQWWWGIESFSRRSHFCWIWSVDLQDCIDVIARTYTGFDQSTRLNCVSMLLFWYIKYWLRCLYYLRVAAKLDTLAACERS